MNDGWIYKVNSTNLIKGPPLVSTRSPTLQFNLDDIIIPLHNTNLMFKCKFFYQRTTRVVVFIDTHIQTNCSSCLISTICCSAKFIHLIRLSTSTGIILKRQGSSKTTTKIILEDSSISRIRSYLHTRENGSNCCGNDHLFSIVLNHVQFEGEESPNPPSMLYL